MGKLERKLDEDLIDRMEAGWTPSARTTPAKKARTARPAKSYRAARRNAAKGTVWQGVKPAWAVEQPHMLLNRSKKWDGVALTRPYNACPVGM